jgi:hypothetical protein
MTVVELVDDRQMEIPGLDGYRAEKLALNLTGGVEFSDLTQAEDVEFVKSLKLGQEVRLNVTATVVKKGFALALGKDEMTEDKTTFGVSLKVSSLQQDLYSVQLQPEA